MERKEVGSHIMVKQGGGRHVSLVAQRRSARSRKISRPHKERGKEKYEGEVMGLLGKNFGKVQRVYKKQGLENHIVLLKELGVRYDVGAAASVGIGNRRRGGIRLLGMSTEGGDDFDFDPNQSSAQRKGIGAVGTWALAQKDEEPHIEPIIIVSHRDGLKHRGGSRTELKGNWAQCSRGMKLKNSPFTERQISPTMRDRPARKLSHTRLTDIKSS